jgi:hypothetical protein
MSIIIMLLSCMGPLFPAHQAYAYSKEYEARYHYVYVQRKDSDEYQYKARKED